jgi:type IV pilus assembly protein PilQ
MKKEIAWVCLAAFAGASLAASPTATTSQRPTPTPVPPAATPVPVSEKRYVGEKISLDLKDADLKDVLATFGKLAHINIAVDPEVHGSVTVQLHDVSWDQALELILQSNGLGYILEGNVLRVGTPAKLVEP